MTNSQQTRYAPIKRGVDTIELGYYIDNPNMWFYESIQKDKLEAQSLNHPVKIALQNSDSTCLEQFNLSPKGTPGFMYVMSNDRYYIKVFGPYKTGKRPRVMVKFMSSWIQELGLMESIKWIEGILSHTIGPINTVKSGISRIDINADFFLDADLFDWNLLGLCRGTARKENQHSRKNVLQTLYIGDKGAPLQCRIYDKESWFLENDKEGLGRYLKQIDLEVVPPGKKLIRVEFQVQGSILKELGLRQISLLPGSIASIWRYCTHNFMWVVESTKPNHQEREVISAWWRSVQDAQGIVLKEVKRIRKEPAVDYGEYYFFRARKDIKEFMAWHMKFDPKRPNSWVDSLKLLRDTTPYYLAQRGLQKEDFGLAVHDRFMEIRDPSQPYEAPNGYLEQDKDDEAMDRAIKEMEEDLEKEAELLRELNEGEVPF